MVTDDIDKNKTNLKEKKKDKLESIINQKLLASSCISKKRYNKPPEIKRLNSIISNHVLIK
ncbi:hypothetical protein HYN56_03105 [Flavobacterium crocinum]|uniref:Uncharacterized protein n=1 Tax=Flavobacterium crocinum TaxID=2183896 RepID=A0A2S1YGV1_9FLAO|nr:hypothetical protein HYN56_03105 [Flavobacterium crocinum]